MSILLDKYIRFLKVPEYRSHPEVSLEDIIKEAIESLRRFLSRIKGRIENVTFCVTDNTRPFPEKKILPPLLSEISNHTGDKRKITILVATGLHRHLTDEELVKKFGEQIVSNYKILQNDPDGSVFIGNEFYINRALADSDIIFGTGVFEPHQYAGFSGGDKIFVIGCGGRKTIDYTHSVKMLLSPGVRLGRAENNPFRKFIEDSARLLPPRWVLNVVMNENGQVIRALSGEPEYVFNALSRWYLQNCTIEFDRVFDAIVTELDSVKGINVYQASRAATYMALSDSPVIKKGAPILILAPLDEGFGRGSGEREFYNVLSSPFGNRELLDLISKEGVKGGGQRAIMLLMTILKHPVIFSGYKRDIDFERENLHFLPDVDVAFDMLLSRFQCKDILYIKNPFYGLFRISEGVKSGK